MADDKSNRGPQDRNRISLDEDYEVRYWTQELGVTEEQLRKAVATAGHSVAAVRDTLARAR